MATLRVYKEAYFIPEGRCKKLIMLLERCEAKNQMWQLKRKRRRQFIDKVAPYLRTKIAKVVAQLGYTNWAIKRTGSKSIYDVEQMHNQSYRVYMWGNGK